MSTTTDVISNLPLPARGVATSDVVRLLNYDVREDIRDELYMTFPDTFRGIQVIPVDLPTALTAAAGSASGSVDNGEYRYKVSYVSPHGETRIGRTSGTVLISDNTTIGQIELTSIPTGPIGTTQRKIYRQQNGSGDYQLLTTLSDNTTTTYTDNTAQASLGAIGQTGIVLADDYYDWLQVKHLDSDIRVAKRSPESSYPDKAYCWIDYTDNPSGTSKQVLSVPDDFPYTDELELIYRKTIGDASEGSDLPYPASLHSRLMPILTLGVAFYDISELSGEDDHVLKLGERYQTAKANLFTGSVTSYQ